MKNKNKYTLGFEVEGLYKHVTERGGYGSQSGERVSPFWSASVDSSIEFRTLKEQEEQLHPVEIVSDILTRDKVKEAFEDFKKLITNGRNIELEKVASFNDSCGCHIHFKLPECNDMKTEVSFYCVDLMKNIFDRRITTAVKKGLLTPLVAKKILKRYYRSYSKKNTTKYGRDSLHWSDEFGTLEWRSFNITGVKTWKDFDTLINIALGTIDEFLRRKDNIPAICIKK